MYVWRKGYNKIFFLALFLYENPKNYLQSFSQPTDNTCVTKAGHLDLKRCSETNRALVLGFTMWYFSKCCTFPTVTSVTESFCFFFVLWFSPSGFTFVYIVQKSACDGCGWGWFSVCECMCCTCVLVHVCVYVCQLYDKQVTAPSQVPPTQEMENRGGAQNRHWIQFPMNKSNFARFAYFCSFLFKNFIIRLKIFYSQNY